MQDRSYVPFTKEMKDTHLILAPNMLPLHFRLILTAMRSFGYRTELLTTDGPEIAQIGLKYTHNDTCYPAILVIGQFLEALLSGRYDTHRVALIMFQTGGGCRASNYIPLIRKALKRAGLEYVPVISFSLAGLEKHPGFRLTLPLARSMLCGVLYGDLLMNLVNQVRSREKVPGTAQRLAEAWTERLAAELGSGGVRRGNVKRNYRMIAESFAAIECGDPPAVRVGIVGEIFVKFSPLGNNDLERFLVKEGAEVTVPGLLDFCLYSFYDVIMEHEVYGQHTLAYPVRKLADLWMLRKRAEIGRALTEAGFRGLTPFERVRELAGEVIHTTVKMGEGWLLPAEMLELAESGCRNIVCTQPFGCLPNHICGKGMMQPIKRLHPELNIVAVDYDAGASRVNQENRLKLMLAAAKDAAEREKET